MYISHQQRKIKNCVYRGKKCSGSENIIALTHMFPLHPFSTPYGFLMFSGGRERVHGEQMG